MWQLSDEQRIPSSPSPAHLQKMHFFQSSLIMLFLKALIIASNWYYRHVIMCVLQGCC